MTVDWTPDGSGIVYVPNSGADWQIWVSQVANFDKPFNWPHPFLIDRPESEVLYAVNDVNWSPDGLHLAINTTYGAYILGVDGTNLHQIESQARWSPDSQQIVFASNRDGNSEIYIMDLESEVVQRLTNNTCSDFSPVWQPTPA